jgi:hypothetical protein
MNRAVSCWTPVALYAGFIFYLSSLPTLTPPLGGLGNVRVDPDLLILHVFEYSILGFLLLRALVNSKTTFTAEGALALAVFLGFLYGVSDEIHQYYVPYRTASLYDSIADGIGAFIGAYVRRDLWPLKTLR